MTIDRKRLRELALAVREILAQTLAAPDREPTQQMIEAARDAFRVCDPGDQWASLAWRAMYDAYSASPTGVRDDAPPPKPIAWMVTRDYHPGHPSFGHPEFFATEPEANENACLGTVDSHVRPLFAAALRDTDA